MDRPLDSHSPCAIDPADIPIVDGRLGGLIGIAPNAYVLFHPDLTIAGCNDAYVAEVGSRHRDIVGRYLFEAFPSDPDSESYRLLRQSLDRVLQSCKTDHIPLIPYPIRAKPVESTSAFPGMRYWSATHTPIVGESGELQYILQHTTDITALINSSLPAERGAIMESGLLMRASQVQAEIERLRDLFDQSPGFVGILRGPDHVFEIANKAYRALVAGRRLLGLPVREALPEVVDQGFIEHLDRVFRTGEPHIGRSESVLLQQMPNLPPEERFVDFAYQPLRDADGVIHGIFVQGVDVTDHRRAEMRMATIINESVHRIKNTLAMAQAVVSATLRNAPDVPTARREILERLSVLAVTQPALIQGRLAPSDVALIVAAVMKLHVDLFGRITMDGPSVEIEASTAQGLALILHELATNAIKYGALSSDNGQISLRWHVIEAENRVELHWQETGGPTVQEPKRKGFGTSLIERTLSRGSGNRVDLTFPPEGVQCRISLALPQ